MRIAILLVAVFTARAGVVSRDWVNGKLTLHLDDGVAQIEWISGTAFHLSRGEVSLPAIKHEPVTPEFEDTRTTLKLRGRFMTLEIDKATAKLRVSASNQTIAMLALKGSDLQVEPIGKAYGLHGPGNSRRFFFTTGYGIFVRAPNDCTFDLDHGMVHSSSVMDLVFYFAPTPKEIFEQHQNVVGQSSPEHLPATSLDSWDALAQLVRTLNQWSLSAVLYPVLDVSALGAGKGEIQKRAVDLASMLPLLKGDDAAIHQAERAAWMPYFETYMREGYDRGYPLIRPFPFEFSHDKTLDPQPDVFMLGDEVLLAPVVAAGNRRKLKLPRGVWTDLRTNTEYKGNQAIEVDAPLEQVPAFARNGAILPLAGKRAMELHYFPSLGGEFFLWEAAKSENSQFHAAPADEFTRVEIESKISRTYEWVIHHTKRPAAVMDGEIPYNSVRQRSSMKPGTWWHDNARNDLHVMLAAEAGTDRIVNISF